nr:MAG TPA: NEMP family [Caudoviricetes sp.]
MIISDEEYKKFIEDGQKYALEILREYFENDDGEVEERKKKPN